ncbi:hypothetical protein [Wolbachia endosymbiont (group A) of Tiphia femorata]|nr:hypothetical protein [Wolbachia endosymbiont (group A) of Tiphia femorata]
MLSQCFCDVIPVPLFVIRVALRCHSSAPFFVIPVLLSCHPSS